MKKKLFPLFLLGGGLGLAFALSSKKSSAAPAGMPPGPGYAPPPPPGNVPPAAKAEPYMPPPVASPAEKVAETPFQELPLPEALAKHLFAVVAANGNNVTAAKGKENQDLVRQFQAAQGLKADGLYGPKTQAALAAFVSPPPPVFYWPKA